MKASERALEDEVLVVDLEGRAVEVEVHQLLILRNLQLHRRVRLGLHQQERQRDARRLAPARERTIYTQAQLWMWDPASIAPLMSEIFSWNIGLMTFLARV